MVGIWLEYHNESSKIVNLLVITHFQDQDPVQILPSHMPLILLMKELEHQRIARLALDKSGLVTI